MGEQGEAHWSLAEAHVRLVTYAVRRCLL